MSTAAELWHLANSEDSVSLVTSSDFHLILDNLPTRAELPTFHVAPLRREKKICLQNSVRAKWDPRGWRTRQITTEKENPGWPSSTAHPGCLRKSLFTLLDFTRIVLNYTGCEIKPRLWPFVIRMLEGTAANFSLTPSLDTGRNGGPRRQGNHQGHTANLAAGRGPWLLSSSPSCLSAVLDETSKDIFSTACLTSQIFYKYYPRMTH